MNDKLKHKYSLPKNFKAEWVKALKSGNYTQGAGALRRENEQLIDKPEYCCLGVACSVAGVPEEYISGEWIEQQYDLELYEYSEVPEVLHGGSDDNELVEVLSTMNDTHTRDTSEHKFSFEDIADWIDENIEGVE
jgi:hypothetical protein